MIEVHPDNDANVTQAIPLYLIASMAASAPFYTEGLGFAMTQRWLDRGKLRWCRLELGHAAIMLQELRNPSPDKLGVGVDLYLQCRDAIAIYRKIKARGVAVQTPFVGNGMWVATLTDPDGYRLHFTSLTDAPEESLLPE